MLRDGKYIREPLPKIGAHYVSQRMADWANEDYAMQQVLLYEYKDVNKEIETANIFPVSYKEIFAIIILGIMLALFFTA